MDIQTLKDFLWEANQAGFASGNEKIMAKQADGSTTITFEKGDFRLNDNYFGGEPYGGRIIVWEKEQPIWLMAYYGWVKDGIEADKIYGALREALLKMPKEMPLRGPKEMASGSFRYMNIWEGDIEKYSGEEQITEEGKVVYKANYLGGWVDTRKGV